MTLTGTGPDSKHPGEGGGNAPAEMLAGPGTPGASAEQAPPTCAPPHEVLNGLASAAFRPPDTRSVAMPIVFTGKGTPITATDVGNAATALGGDVASLWSLVAVEPT